MVTNGCLYSSTEVVEMLSHTNYEGSNYKRKVKTSFGSPVSGLPVIGGPGLDFSNERSANSCLGHGKQMNG